MELARPVTLLFTTSSYEKTLLESKKNKEIISGEEELQAM